MLHYIMPIKEIRELRVNAHSQYTLFFILEIIVGLGFEFGLGLLLGLGLKLG